MGTEFEALKRSSWLQLLFKTARLAEERALDQIRQEIGVPGLRRAHMALFPHIDFAGTRLTQVAESLGVRKQSAATLVEDLVVWGMLERVPDPADGRAKLIRFAGGEDELKKGMGRLLAFERTLAARLGSDSAETLHSSLLRLEAILTQ